jgi:cell division protein FtsN
VPHSVLQRGYLSGGGLLFLVVAAVGLFSGYLYWLKSSSSGVEVAAKQALKPKPKVEQRASKEKADDQFHFDFFSMLPEEEYIGIEERKPAPKTAPQPRSSEKSERPVSVAKTAIKSTPTGNYLIQMGAFSRLDSAEQHKAELILMGVENVEIHTIQSAKGALYRVNVGPFQSFSSAEHQQAQLKKAGYNSFLKKYKPSAR